MEKRKVTVYASNAGNEPRIIQSNADAWGALQEGLSAEGMSAAGMKAVVGETKNSLESRNAKLPEGDFTLFLLPKRTKSGVTDYGKLSYKELRQQIVAVVKFEGKPAKEFFKIGKKNHTQLGTAEMISKLRLWDKKHTEVTVIQETAVEKLPEDKKDVFVVAKAKVINIEEEYNLTKIEGNLMDEIVDTISCLESKIKKRLGKDKDFSDIQLSLAAQAKEIEEELI